MGKVAKCKVPIDVIFFTRLELRIWHAVHVTDLIVELTDLGAIPDKLKVRQSVANVKESYPQSQMHKTIP